MKNMFVKKICTTTKCEGGDRIIMCPLMMSTRSLSHDSWPIKRKILTILLSSYFFFFLLSDTGLLTLGHTNLYF
jgi:hypothetical protein